MPVISCFVTRYGLKCLFYPISFTYDLYGQRERSRNNMHLIGDYHNNREGHKYPVSSSFRPRVTAYCVSAVDSRRG